MKKMVIKLFRRVKAFYYLKTRQFGNTKIQSLSIKNQAVNANSVKKRPAFHGLFVRTTDKLYDYPYNSGSGAEGMY